MERVATPQPEQMPSSPATTGTPGGHDHVGDGLGVGGGGVVGGDIDDVGSRQQAAWVTEATSLRVGEGDTGVQV